MKITDKDRIDWMQENVFDLKVFDMDYVSKRNAVNSGFTLDSGGYVANSPDLRTVIDVMIETVKPKATFGTAYLSGGKDTVDVSLGDVVVGHITRTESRWQYCPKGHSEKWGGAMYESLDDLQEEFVL